MSLLTLRIPIKKLTLIHVRLHVVRVGGIGERGAWGGGGGQRRGGRLTLRPTAAALWRNRGPVAIWNLQELSR